MCQLGNVDASPIQKSPLLLNGSEHLISRGQVNNAATRRLMTDKRDRDRKEGTAMLKVR